jgi:HPt (histidine-containing phosphotransfer) domain-containing protein
VLYEDWENVYEKAHKLKSALGVLQMNSMLEDISAIEISAKEKKDLETVPLILLSVFDQYDLILPMIKADLNRTEKQLINPT